MISVYTQRYQHVLDRLVEARQASGLTQAEAADAFGKPQSFISKCESGERRVDVVELDHFAHLYHKPLAYFVAEGGLGSGGILSDRPRKKGPRGGRRGKARSVKVRAPKPRAKKPRGGAKAPQRGRRAGPKR